jgi:hypothetical protein
VAPFQLEVGNLWWVMEDMAKGDKKIMSKFGAFASLFVSLYLMNEAAEKTTGQRVTIDPIKAGIDATKLFREEKDKGKGAYKAGGRLAGEVLSNIPFGQSLVDLLYPKYGATIAGVELPTRKEFFGRADPTRFGGGLLSTKALMDPIYKILPPFGGGQIKKTVEGYKSIQEGKSSDKSGRAQFDVGGTALKDAQALAFGKYAGSEARSFFNTGTTYAETTLNKIRTSPTGEEDLKKIVTENPQLWQNIKEVLRKEQLGITKDDEKLLNMGVANKERAEAVAKEFRKLDNEEEQKALLLDYRKKKILTTEVLKQFVELINK